MIGSEEEMNRVMEFFATKMVRQMVGLEGHGETKRPFQIPQL